MNEQFEVADLLLEQGADINASWGLHEPATILHEFAGNGRLLSVRYALSKGADVGARDQRYSATPLGWAEFMGEHEVAAHLRGVSGSSL